MSFVDLALAIFAGNAITACFLWGFSQFVKKDEAAPWTAYVAFILPLACVALTIAIAEPLPQFDALAAR